MVKAMVDVRKYASGAYLKPADLDGDGPVEKRIINVAETEGKFGPKLDLWFDDGARLSLSGKNVGELMRAYGTDSDLWLDRNVELHVEEFEDRAGETKQMIVLVGIDPVVPPAERPKLTPLPPKPKEDKTPAAKPVSSNQRADRDDEIPF
jgi:hypothetical protein